MEELTKDDIRALLFLVRNRLRYESRRPSRIKQGKDIQNEKVWELSALREKLEAIGLNA